MILVVHDAHSIDVPGLDSARSLTPSRLSKLAALTHLMIDP
ncbi:hypothetical protein [Pseudonocardia alaniniphila]